jgi:hypothetical protein
MKIIENNEQVIGRTLVSHNKKLKELESGESGQPSQASLASLKAEIKEDLKKELKQELSREMESQQSGVLHIEEASTGAPTNQVKEFSRELEDLKRAVNRLKQEIDEVKYVLDTVNPLEYVTIEHLGDLIEKKVREESIKIKKN